MNTNIAIDRMMVNFIEWSIHNVRLPEKSISIGYNLLAICDFSYTLNWLFIFYVDLIACLEKDPNLSTMGLALLQLCCTINAEN